MPWTEALIASKSSELSLHEGTKMAGFCLMLNALNEAMALALGLDPNVIMSWAKECK